MPFDGSGVFSFSASVRAVTGTVIQSVEYNRGLDEIIEAINLPVTIARGGTDASSASGARTSLGLEIGTDVQAYSAELTALGSVTGASNTLPFFDTGTTVATTPFSIFSQGIVGSADAPEWRVALDIPSNSEAVLQTQVGTAANNIVQLNGTAQLPAVDGSQLTGITSQVEQAQIWEQQGGVGGGAVAGVWTRRTLNSENDPFGLVSVTTGQFTANVNGTVYWTAPGYLCGFHVTRLFNVTDGVQVKLGSSEISNSNVLSTTSSGTAYVVAGKTYEIQHNFSNTRTFDGFGTAHPTVSPNIYAQVTFTRS